MLFIAQTEHHQLNAKEINGCPELIFPTTYPTAPSLVTEKLMFLNSSSTLLSYHNLALLLYADMK